MSYYGIHMWKSREEGVGKEGEEKGRRREERVCLKSQLIMQLSCVLATISYPLHSLKLSGPGLLL